MATTPVEPVETASAQPAEATQVQPQEQSSAQTSAQSSDQSSAQPEHGRWRNRGEGYNAQPGEQPADPAQQQRRMPPGPEPHVAPTARVRDCTLGIYTRVGEGTSMSSSTFGDYSYVVGGCSIVWSDIGKFCSIASSNRFNPGNHPMWRAALHHFTYRSRSYGFELENDEEFFDWRKAHRVTLGNDVWVGHGGVILPGVKIGIGAGIGAGAVVSKDVPNFAIVGGVPAKLIRFRIPEKVQEGLLKIAWWDWSREQLEAGILDLRKMSAEEFVEKYESASAPAV